MYIIKWAATCACNEEATESKIMENRLPALQGAKSGAKGAYLVMRRRDKKLGEPCRRGIEMERERRELQLEL